jgi:RNA polymerase sigma-70 factor (ECF subfamily)
MLSRDPLANPEYLIRRVYAYVAYRIGDGADAEDVTSDAFERALRYRASYDEEKGDPIAWLVGIARRSIADWASRRQETGGEPEDVAAPGELEKDTLRRLDLRAAVARLSDDDRELISLRYGADLSARQIAEVLERKTNAVEVAIHRALARLRKALEQEDTPEDRAKSSLGAAKSQEPETGL